MGMKHTAPAAARRASRGGAVTGRRQLGSPGRTVTPLYHQMYRELREKVRSGDLDPQQPLPGEHHLASSLSRLHAAHVEATGDRRADCEAPWPGTFR
jgi:hypothetical protein